MIKLLLKLLGMPEGQPEKSGKREVAAMFAFFTAALVVWGFGSFDQSGRLSTIYLLVPSALAMLGGAFGLEAMFKQGGLSFKNGKEAKNERARTQNTDDDLG